MLGEAGGRELLAEVRGNPGTTERLRIEAVTYIQGKEPNRNFVRFKESKLRAIARSFKGMPFLRDHKQGQLDARGGTILDSKILERDDGSKAFVMSVELTKPWAIEGVLDGTIDRFSIGWHPTGPICCSACGEPFTEVLFWIVPSCAHTPGEVIENDDGTSEVVQMEFQAAEGVEVSAVSVPAVVGTEIEDVRAALAAAREQGRAPREIKSMTTVAKKLGLDEDASEKQILAEIEKREILHAGTKEQLTASEASLTDARAELATLQTERTERRTKALESKLLSKGWPVDGDTAKAVLAMSDLGLAEKAADELPQRAPIGPRLQSAGADPTPRDGEVVLTAGEKKLAAEMGLTEEKVLETKKKLAKSGR